MSTRENPFAKTAWILAAVVLALHAAAAPTSAVVYNATADFDASLDPAGPGGTNPNGVWTYGETAGLLGVLVPLPDPLEPAETECSAVNMWLDLDTHVQYTPSVGKTIAPCDEGGVSFSPGQLILTGGPPDRYAHVVFTAPSDSQCSVAATFTARQNGVSADVHVLSGGAAVFSDTLVGDAGTETGYYPVLTLAAGDTVSFAVGLGAPPQELHPGNVELQVEMDCIPQPGLVDCSTQKLQDAINAHDSDTIRVTGTCNENIGFWGSGITLDGGGTATINGVDANLNTVEVKGQSLTIRGFTITGGKAGIFVYRDEYALIEDNTIENTGGHGIELRNTTTTKIINNTIRNNPEDGIYVADNSFARIGFSFPTDTVASPNVIEDNGGNGITLTRLSSARIVGNTVRGNGGNGIAVERVSQADISDNTINGNKENGILVTQNSGGNLGNDQGTTIYDKPNKTTVKNIKFGIKCTIGGYVDGRRGSLDGLKKAVSVDSDSMNKTIP